MSVAQIREKFPERYGAAVIAVLFASFVYAVFTMQIGGWLLGLVAMISLGLSVVAVYLLYRLVLAVERIAYNR